MERALHGQPNRTQPPRLQLGHRPVDGVTRPRKDARGGRVDRGQRQPVRVGDPHGLVLLQRHGHHGARRRLLHEPSAQRGQAQGVRKVEDARERGGGQLAQTVPEQRRGTYAPVLPQPAQSDPDGDDRRLDEGGTPQLLFARTAQQIRQFRSEVRAQGGRALVERRTEHRVRVVQTHRRARQQGTLPGQQERHGCVDPVGAGAHGLTPAPGAARGDGPGGVPGQHEAPVVELPTAGAQGSGDVGEGHLGMGFEVVGQARDGRREGG